MLVAGAGVAGLEALLALDELARDRLDVTLLAPDSEFRYRQLSVVTPFEHLQPEGFSIDEITRELGVHHRRGLLAGVDAESRRVRTKAGTEIDFDLLLVAVGVGAHEAIPGALTFRGLGDAMRYRELLASVESGSVGRLTFAVPSRSAWPLPLYELALFTAQHAKTAGREVMVDLVSPEAAPLAIFGEVVSIAIAALLRDSGIRFHGDQTPVAFTDGELALEGGETVTSDSVVSLPTPSQPGITGLSCDEHGFIHTDAFGRVPGSEVVFAAGDATWHPIKQGGLAAQQADAAASAIAELAGSPVTAAPSAAILRGALLTPWGPRYLRHEPGYASTFARAILWWPPTKVAGSRLGPYLARRSGGEAVWPGGFHDVDPVGGDHPLAHTSGHEDAFQLALTSAQGAADERQFRRAVGWLRVAEDLELRLPASFQAKRIAWRELAERPQSASRR